MEQDKASAGGNSPRINMCTHVVCCEHLHISKSLFEITDTAPQKDEAQLAWAVELPTAVQTPLWSSAEMLLPIQRLNDLSVSTQILETSVSEAE